VAAPSAPLCAGSYLVPVTEWHPTSAGENADTIWLYGGVGRKP
jgi:hypothetical protein